MAITTIQFKRGLVANLPKLSVAELAFTTDTKQVFVGTGQENLQLALSADVTSALTAAKAYADSGLKTLDTKVQGDIATAIGKIDLVVPKATAEKDGLLAKEDKVILDKLAAKEAAWDGKETVAGAQAKAAAAEANAKAYTDGKFTDLVGSAPETLDTIHELAAAIKSLEEDDVAGLVQALAGKADSVHKHAATDITEDATHRFVTDANKTAWSGKAEKSDITTAVTTAQTALQGNIDTLAGRVQKLEAVAVIDGGTF